MLPEIIALIGSVAFAQAPIDRVLHFTQAETDRELQEIATNIRAIAEIPQISVDAAQKTVTLHGTAAQIALAEWLLTQWDKSAPAQPPQDYQLSSDDLVRVFHLAHTPTPQSLQGMATDVRTVANIRRLFTYNESSVITARGDASQLALAEWLVNQLDQPANHVAPGTASPEYHATGGIEDLVRVFYPAYVATPQELQEMATAIRTLASIRLFFIYTQSNSLIVRARAPEMALAGWLVNELDQPANQPPRTPAPHEYRPSGDEDDIVRVFFLTHAESPQRLQEIATEVRSTTDVKKLFTYNAPRAIALRGTGAQITLAGRMIAERDQ